MFSLRERVSVSRYIYLTLLFIFVLAAVMPVAGEGSREYNSNDSSLRNYLQGYGYGNSQGIPTPVNQYVYMRAGEQMYLGSSVFDTTADEITVTNPAGTVTKYNVTQNGNGHIQNRTQEKAGPKPLDSSGYTPIIYTASTEGIYTVRFYGNPDVTTRARRYFNNQDWTQKTYNIEAWDITVVSASGQRINGRVFMATASFASVGNDSNDDTTNTTSLSVYILTEKGYLYRVSATHVTPMNYELASSNIGNMVNNHSAYTSFHGGNVGVTDAAPVPGYTYFERDDFEHDSNNGGVMNRIFYNRPDSALLTYLGLPANGTPIVSAVSNLRFNGDSSDEAIVIKGKGGTFTFDCTSEGEKYILTLNFGDGNELRIPGTTSSTNTIVWDGKDANGNVFQSGTLTAKLELLAGENHFILADFEYIYDGIVIQRLNGSNSNRYLVYYDHTPHKVDGYANFMSTSCVRGGGNCSRNSNVVEYAENNGWIVNANDPSLRYTTSPLKALDGVDSSSGASKAINYWSDYKVLDFWAYDNSAPLLYTIVDVIDEKINIRVNKLWEDENDRDGVRPENITVKLTQNNVDYDTASITGLSGNTWTYTFQNLPKYDTNGELFEYSVEEVVE